MHHDTVLESVPIWGGWRGRTNVDAGELYAPLMTWRTMDALF
jgi:hypothetical protein